MIVWRESLGMAVRNVVVAPKCSAWLPVGWLLLIIIIIAMVAKPKRVNKREMNGQNEALVPNPQEESESTFPRCTKCYAFFIDNQERQRHRCGPKRRKTTSDIAVIAQCSRVDRMPLTGIDINSGLLHAMDVGAAAADPEADGAAEAEVTGGGADTAAGGTEPAAGGTDTVYAGGGVEPTAACAAVDQHEPDVDEGNDVDDDDLATILTDLVGTKTEDLLPVLKVRDGLEQLSCCPP